MKLITLSFIILFAAQGLFAQYEETFTNAEQMPYFSGCKDLPVGSKEKRDCSNQKLISFISQNLQYPAKAKVDATEGTVYVSFVVAVDGKVIEPTILHDIGGDCGSEALRVVKMMPNFEAGMNEEKSVNVKLNLPIHFTLENLEIDKSNDYSLSWGGLKGGKITKDQLRKNLYSSVQIRNKKGDDLLVNELIFSFEKGTKIHSGKSRGEITKEMIKVIAKAKTGGVFRLSANFQEGGEFIFIDRLFEIVD